MTSARRGISNHLMVESFERIHKHLLTLGYSQQEATRGAVALTAAFSGEYTREQAWEVANAIAPAQQRTTGAVTAPEQTDLTQPT